MNTLPRAMSTIKKEISKNFTAQKDTEMIHLTVKKGRETSMSREFSKQC